MKRGKIFYCYGLLWPDGTPFYVGKGHSGPRVVRHVQAALRGAKGHKYNIIRKIVRDGETVGYVQFAEGLTESEAFAKEIEMVAAIGRRPNGFLVNKTDGGEGTAGWKQKASTIVKRVAARQAKDNYTHTLEARTKISIKKKGVKLGPSKLRGRNRSAAAIAKHRATLTARGPIKQSPEIIARRVATRRANGSYDYANDMEWRAKQSAAHKGKKLSMESIVKREATKRANGSHRHTPESRAKIAAKAMGRKLSAETIAKRTATRRANATARGVGN